MAQQHNDWADITSLDTFPKVLQHNAKHWPEEVAMREKEFGIWREFTWRDYEDRVKWMALALEDLGLGEQDVVGLLRYYTMYIYKYNFRSISGTDAHQT